MRCATLTPKTEYPEGVSVEKPSGQSRNENANRTSIFTKHFGTNLNNY